MRVVVLLLVGACHPPPTGDTDPVLPKLRLGLCDGWNAPRLDLDGLRALDPEIHAAAALGLDLVRPHRPRGHAFAFSVVAPPGGTGFDWTLPDHVVTVAQQAGVDLLVTIQPITDPRDPSEAPPEVVPSTLPAEVEPWRGFVHTMVERYDGDGQGDMPGLDRPVRHWEIGNEPACAPDDALCHQGFLDLVTVTAAVVRDADPDAFVLAGASAPLFHHGGAVNTSADAVYAHFVANGGPAHTNALNIHLTTGSDTPDVAASLAAWRERTDATNVWITETATRAPDDDLRVGETEEDEASWLVEHLDDAAAEGVTTALWCLTGGELDRFPAVTDAIATY